MEKNERKKYKIKKAIPAKKKKEKKKRKKKYKRKKERINLSYRQGD